MASTPDAGGTTWIVGPDDARVRLDRFVVGRLVGASRNQISRGIEEGRLTRNGQRPPKAGVKLTPGDVISWQPLERSLGDPPVAQDIPVDIVYQDDALAVVNKPSGLVVHPAAGHLDGTLVNALMFHLGSLSEAGGADRPGIVHRLDRDTSGLLLVARRDDVHRELSQRFKDHIIRRRYLAVVLGPRLDDAGTIETLYARAHRDRRRMTGKATEGRRACTHWRVLARAESMALVMLQLETGRTHQIRVHLSERGHPVVGDELYGRRPPKGGAGRVAVELAAARRMPRQALHAGLLGFDHPVSGEPMEFTSPLPEDMATLVAAVFGDEWPERAVERLRAPSRTGP